MQRRYFLLSGSAAACGLVGWQFARSADQSAIVKVVHKKLRYLRLDEAGVQRFAPISAASKTISDA